MNESSRWRIEPPEAADLKVDTTRESVSDSVERIIRYVEKKFVLVNGEDQWQRQAKAAGA